MRILILNWRDIKHPSSGGAEILTHEIAKRWVEQGHQVTQFSSYFKGAAPFENIDGIGIIRKGHPDARYLFASVHFKAVWHYLRFFKGNIDVVIDEIHGLPFFTPLYITEKKVALICEVADELWTKIYGPFFGSFGRFVEILYLRLLYKNIHFITISNSTRNELIKNGIDLSHIHVIPMGIRKPPIATLPEKEKNPTLIYVGRISKAKGIESAIKVLKKVKKKLPSAKLWIIGKGEQSYINLLETFAAQTGVANSITFFGYVSEQRKFELMARAHVLIAPSVKEGFGLIVPEAGIVETVSVAYDVLGLKDIIKNKKNGILVNESIEKMAEAVIRLLTDKALYSRIQKSAKAYAQNLNFEKAAKAAFKILS